MGLLTIHLTNQSARGVCLAVASFMLFGTAYSQTPTLDRLKEALALERSSDLVAAQAIYSDLINDPDWAAAALLSLGRVQRWQSLHDKAVANYEAVLRHPQATQGMKDEANVGLAQIDALEMRLAQAQERLNAVGPTSPVYAQANQLRTTVLKTHPTRIAANYGQVHNKGGSTDSSWQLRLTHQLDMRNTASLGYASNSLQQRSTQPDAALDFVKGQWSAAWRHKVPQGPSYNLELTHRSLNLGSHETSLRAQMAWSISSAWGATAALQRDKGALSGSTSGSLGINTKASKSVQVGATLFAGETAAGTLYSWMLNSTWEQGPWLAQWFVARSLDNSPVSNTLVVRQRLSSGPSWRAEVKNDKNGNSAFFGLDVPWGQHMVTTSVNRYPAASQWTVGFDYAWPNGVPKPADPHP
jgi:hypothetical protein